MLAVFARQGGMDEIHRAMGGPVRIVGWDGLKCIVNVGRSHGGMGNASINVGRSHGGMD